MRKLNQWLKKTEYIPVIIVLLLVAAGVYAAKNIGNEQTANADATETTPIAVQTAVLDLDATYSDVISSVGTVKADASVDVVALSGGTVRGIFFEVGDKVTLNQTLAILKNDQTATNYVNANTQVANALSSKEQSRMVANEAIRQAELGVQNSLESVQSAEIGLQAARDNLNNIGEIRDKGSVDIKNNAVTLFYGYINSVKSALEQIDYIIDAEDDGNQLPGIDATISAKNPLYLNNAIRDYNQAKSLFDSVKDTEPDSSNITASIDKVVNVYGLTKNAVDDTINVLDNTVSHNGLPESTLNAQKSSFSVLRANMISTLNAVKVTQQGLENIGLSNNQELTALENAVKSAQNQLDLARLGYENALVALATAKQSKEQQLNAAESAVDSAKGQENLVGSQIADLSIKAPISGEVTKKLVELGTEVSPGQAIANVSKTDIVKIVINLPSEDVYRIKIGQEAELGDELLGHISLIDPAADPITKKVKVEIIYDNFNKDLIPGTFIDVRIPVEKLEKTQPESFYIPLRAANITQTESFVFINSGGFAKKTQVVTGKTQGAMIEIIDGLNNGDELVVEGSKLLDDNTPISINNQ